MKKVFNDRISLYFNDYISTQEIVDFLNMNKIDELFNILNDPYSCTANIVDDEIYISGDEDYIILNIKNIAPII